MKLLKLSIYVLAGGMLFDSLYGFSCLNWICFVTGQRVQGYLKAVRELVKDGNFKRNWGKLNDCERNIFGIKLYFGTSFNEIKVISRTLNIKSMNMNVSPYVYIL
jgi:hypothetical protein